MSKESPTKKSKIKLSNVFEFIVQTPYVFSFEQKDQYKFLETLEDEISVMNYGELNALAYQILISLRLTEDDYGFFKISLALFLIFQKMELGAASLCISTANDLLSCLEENDEKFWYKSCLIRWKTEDQKDYLELFQKINSMDHKKCLAIWILQDYEKTKEYPQYSDLIPLENFFKEKFNINLEGFCSQTRLKFILTKLQNKKYFDLENLDLLEFEEENQKIQIGEQSVYFSLKDLRKFVAHIIPLSRPILEITVSGLDSTKQTIFNHSFAKKLKELGNMNETGMLTSNKFEITNIKRHVNDILKQFGMISNGDDFIQNIILELEKINKIRSKLEGLTSIKAISFASKCFIFDKYGFEKEKCDKIQEMLRYCAEINILAEKHNKHPNREAKWFKLAEDIIKSISENPRDVLIQVGTPRSMNENSTHSFYVALKFLGENMFEIVITNGGAGIQYHEVVENQKTNEQQHYHYATSEPFKLNEIGDALTHYVKRLISLEFRVASKKKEVPMNYFIQMENIYLWNTSFGYNEKFTCFKRKNSEKSFLEQIFGNCTVHNLKESLQYLYCENELDVGLLEATMVLGFDKMLSKFNVGLLDKK
jgi:hypothetical protein